MILNYLKIALRNLAKRRVFTAINIIGLATGVAICLLIGKYIAFASSYDKFHTNGTILKKQARNDFENPSAP
jgi:putative ABC transport system permease protein